MRRYSFGAVAVPVRGLWFALALAKRAALRVARLRFATIANAGAMLSERSKGR